ncbi:hypothetical protein [uncultured Psychroserpens sp.]|uniref:hypothetical protein n=1 Tax=uncultured Psychroserpens sp. TaxID=255436 RepID=UPI0026086570|nr:hypothetical protein [uncultured Psychroserpens sp.]
MKKLIDKIFGEKNNIEKTSFLTVSDKDLTISERFSKWINLIESGNLPTEKIQGLNFGLFQSSDSYMMYLIGAEIFDEKDENWACEVDYEPEYKYLDLNDLKLNDSDWKYVLDYSVELISNYLKLNDSFLSKIENITTGFDNGNLIRLK